ncbi:hypothetical protein EVAR_65147_1 [Eumeta japonica]|uniref:Uncharacterized protein n=1 Tax=Eumeta variegata TaxID=151549 RepID=A0A4C2A0D9_EUMVA|nr:hypothetical protein EVAR_65147_1 [Eumeta japonica]
MIKVVIAFPNVRRTGDESRAPGLLMSNKKTITRRFISKGSPLTTEPPARPDEKHDVNFEYIKYGIHRQAARAISLGESKRRFPLARTKTFEKFVENRITRIKECP